MNILEIKEIRESTKLLFPDANFDIEYKFYYDESNNLRKFYIRDDGFNYNFKANFILGGLVHEGNPPDISNLINEFNLQKTTKEVKFKYIAKGSFLDCLTSQKLNIYFNFIKNSNLNIHYSSLNYLYWSIVDIVNSALVGAELDTYFNHEFELYLKNCLYNISKLEIEKVKNLFYKFKYPNIHKNQIIEFIENLIIIFDDYIDKDEFHLGLETIKQILKNAKKKNSLLYITDEEDYILLDNFSQLYLRPIYLFKNSIHTFDNEDAIIEQIKNYKIYDGNQEINNYTFVDSIDNQLIQLSDIFVGVMGKFSQYINTNSRNKLETDLLHINSLQNENLKLFTEIIDEANKKNIGLIHSIDSIEEMSKMDFVYLKST